MSRVLSPERIKGNKLKFKVLERDGYMCRICGSDENLEVHHMLALTFGGKSTMKNMITLCSDCHKYAPEDGIKTNIEYLRNRNRIIYEHLVTMPESFAMITVAITEYLKEKVNDYVKEGFISDEQKEKILDYQLNKIISWM
jgi:hypothetical protein